MEVERREKRRQELIAIRLAEPSRLVAIYRTASGIQELAALPNSVTFESIIEAILDCELGVPKPPTSDN